MQVAEQGRRSSGVEKPPVGEAVDLVTGYGCRAKQPFKVRRGFNENGYEGSLCPRLKD